MFTNRLTFACCDCDTKTEEVPLLGDACDDSTLLLRDFCRRVASLEPLLDGHAIISMAPVEEAKRDERSSVRLLQVGVA
jgi:hypothetical protein